ncbi:MAG: GNAT family N-acetyltransferase [Stomatobaculum sp.]|nr:GNAT family N-acetyltransferase [Stomatobaculum sp.]
MTIRHSAEQDVPRIMEIYAHARAFMAAHGNPRQWGATNWPPEALIRQDIAAGHSFVCLEGDAVVGTFFYICGEDPEPTYQEITEGAWMDDSPYGVVHRIAVDGSVKGTGSFCLNWAVEQSGGHLRIDTHGDNHVMQSLLKKLGFQQCGIIYVEEDNDPRLAFEISRHINNI